MRRLKALLLCNNSVSKIGPNLGDNISRMQTIILTNNRVSNLFEIDHLSTVKTLEMLSLLENPVALKPNYRLYAIYRIPTLKCLDFSKVTKQERDDAARMFKSSAGKAFLNLVAQEKQMAANAAAKNGTATKPTIMELTDGQKEQVKQAIERATTKEQIDTIEYQLQVKSIVLSSPIFFTFLFCSVRRVPSHLLMKKLKKIAAIVYLQRSLRRLLHPMTTTWIWIEWALESVYIN